MRKTTGNLLRSNKSTHLLFLLMAVGIFVLSLFFIKSEDDFTYLEKFSALDSVFISLRFGNGRYLGNFFCRFLINRFLLDRIVRTLCFCTIVLFSALLTGGYKKRILLLSCLLYLGMSNDMFSQVFTWGSGFYNYTPPIAIMLVSLYFVKKCYENDAKHTKIIGLFLLTTGFCQQLFIENCTTINVLISGFIFFVAFRKKLQNRKTIGLYFFGSIFGAAVMFLLPSAMGVSYKMKQYRAINSISEYCSNALENAVRIMNDLSEQAILWLLVSILILALLKNRKTSFKQSSLLLNIIKGYVAVYPVFSLIQMLNHNVTVFLIIDAAFVLYCCLIVFVIIKASDEKHKKVVIGVLGLTVLSLLQLLIIKPCRARCVFLPYVVLALLFLIAFEKLSKKQLNT